MILLDFLFPRRCISCGKLGSYFCPTCIKEIQYIKKPICPLCGEYSFSGLTHPRCQTPLSLDGMFAFCSYQGVIKEAIHLLKYKFVTDIAGSLVDLLISSYPKNMPQFDYLTPVPLHKKREKHRGFNQSFLLASHIGERLNIPVENKILFRKRNTIPQFELEKKKRKTNLLHSFSCIDKKSVKDKIIGLVDDVATTQSTLLECTKELKRKKARKVWGIVLAHG